MAEGLFRAAAGGAGRARRGGRRGGRAGGCRLALAVMLLAVAVSAPAQEQGTPDGERRQDLTNLSIEQLMQIEVVYGPSRYAQKASEAPSSVTLVTAAQIKQYGYRTLADVLRSLRGFYVTYDRNYAYVGIRGFGRPGDYNSRLLVLVDGHRINDNIYGSVLVENGFVVDLDVVERVEVVRGPNSSIYGTSAFFPVIVNIITKSANALESGVAIEAASFGTVKERAAYAGRVGAGVDLVAAAAHSDSRGQRLYFPEFDSPDTNNGIADRADGEHYSNALLGVTFGEATFEAAYVLREKGIPTGSFGTLFNDPATRTWDETAFASLKVAHDFGKTVSVAGQLSYDRYRYRGDYVTDYPPVTLNRDASFGDWLTAEALAVYRGVAGHTVILGVEIEQDLHQDQRNYDVAPQVDYLDVRNRSSRWAVYTQDEVRLSSRLILNLGLRFDRRNDFGSDVSPRLAMIYIPSPATSMKLLLGRTHRPPNQFEAFYAAVSPEHRPNPKLRSESIESVELVLDHSLGNRFRLTAYGFLYRIEDLISLEDVPFEEATQYRNAGRIESEGFELELVGDLGRGVNGRFSYTVEEAEGVASDQQLTNSPKHLLKMNVAAPLVGNRLSAGLEAQYSGERLTLAGRRDPGFTVVNLTLVAPRVLGRAEVSASVYNLLDRRYADPGSEEHLQDVIQQDGRNYRLTLRWQW